MPGGLGTISVQYRQCLVNDSGAASISVKLQVTFYLLVALSLSSKQNTLEQPLNAYSTAEC